MDSNLHITFLQGSVVTRLRCSVNFMQAFAGNLIPIVAVKKHENRLLLLLTALLNL